MTFNINPEAEIPKYKQVLSAIESKIVDGTYKKGAHLPSMNDIATETGISKETVKRALVNLRDRGYISSCPGKGYYVSVDLESIQKKTNILMILGRLDIFKQMLVDSFTSALMGKADVRILLHNGEVEQLESALETSLNQYDYYVVSPHFAIDDQTQMRVAKLLKKIPNRKLILLDHCNRFMTGHFGAVYQDFEKDPAIGLSEGLDRLKKAVRLNIIMLPSSRYGEWVKSGVIHFCESNEIPYSIMEKIPECLERGEVFLLLTGVLSNELAKFDIILKKNGMKIGEDVGLIAYNDVPLNSVVLGGLTTISTDFVKMGEIAAQMILSNTMSKVHSEFHMIRRRTF